MIKVTLGKVKTQKEKPYPKLMTDTDGVIYYFIRKDYGLPLYKWDEEKWEEFSTLEATSWKGINMRDYNEPITIQNA